MMALLRSRTTMFVLVGLVTVGLVATGAVGLFNAVSAPPPAGAAPEGGDAAAIPAPPVDSLGAAPDGTSYTDLGEQCESGECYRLVGVTAEDDGTDGEAAVDAVYGHLIDEGWARVLPDGEDAPEDVPMADSYLTDGSVLLRGSTTPYDTESTAGLMLVNAQLPAS
ncbi:hypothetical protein [Nocardiopsis trehalosi]|jgi:hypothetical protein|uniref:hypothetical protein n=1 Tax=Nocardiopsis trehalosi TaxID=109329 RepID=UPI00082DC49D|nr:hypothetical protein [Nocardiopsis trehalosi]